MWWIDNKISKLLLCDSPTTRKHLSEVITIGVTMLLTIAFAITSWIAWALYCGTESPMIIVLSESMEPAFKRGDLLFLCNNDDPIRAGEVVVFVIDDYPIPIVHRVIEVHEDSHTGDIRVLTKGDNNEEDDRVFYIQDQKWVQRDHILGRAIGYLPYLGWINLAMFDSLSTTSQWED